MFTDQLGNMMRGQAIAVSRNTSSTRFGIVSSFDPETWSAKVLLQPENVETGWLPVGSAWVGQEWGMFAPPNIGDMCQVEFQEGDQNAGLVVMRFYNDQDRPLPVPSGEFWIVHKSGSALKFKNDGSVEITAHTNLTATVGGNLIANVTGNATTNVAGNFNATAASFTFSANVTIDGNLNVTGTITDTTNITFADIKSTYNSHVHGSSPTPTPTL